MAADKRYIDEDFQGNKALSLSGVTDASGNPLASAFSIVSVTASATTGTATIALGTNVYSYCSLTTTGTTAVTVNITGSIIQILRLKLVLTSPTTLVLNYNGGTTFVWPGGASVSFPTGKSYLFEFFCTGSEMQIGYQGI